MTDTAYNETDTEGKQDVKQADGADDILEVDWDSIDDGSFDAFERQERIDSITAAARRRYGSGTAERVLFEAELSSAKTEKQQNNLVKAWARKVLPGAPADDKGIKAAEIADARRQAAEANPEPIVNAVKIGKIILDRYGDRILIVARTDGDGDSSAKIANAHGIWRDGLDEFRRWTREAARQIVLEAVAAEMAASINDLRRDANRYFTDPGVKSVRTMLRSAYLELLDERNAEDFDRAGVKYKQVTTCDPSELDSDMRWLGTPSGVVDMLAPCGGILPPMEARRKFVTRTVAVDWIGVDGREDADAEADVVKVLAHLADEDREFLLRSIAFAMFGNLDRRIVFLIGEGGGEGKSTFLNALRRMMGRSGYAMSTDAFLPATQSKGGIDSVKKALMGIRIAISADVESAVGARFVARVKGLSGGDNTSARNPFETELTEGELTGTMFIAVNGLPDFWGDSSDKPANSGDSSNPIDDRIYTVGYPAFTGETDISLRDRLKRPSRMRVLLREVVKRCPEVWKSPPQRTDNQRAYMRNVRNERTNGAVEWIEDNIVKTGDREDKLFTSEVAAAAEQSTNVKEGERPFGLTKQALTQLVTTRMQVGNVERFYKPGFSKQERGWRGLRLRTGADTPDTPRRLGYTDAPQARASSVQASLTDGGTTTLSDDAGAPGGGTTESDGDRMTCKACGGTFPIEQMWVGVRECKPCVEIETAPK